MKFGARLFSNMPPPAIAVVGLLALGVPAICYGQQSVLAWQIKGSPAFTLTEPLFLVIAVGRSVGALVLAALLLMGRDPVAVAITLTAVWLGGPPMDFLLKSIGILAASGGRASWAGSLFGWLGRSAFVPVLVTIALLVPHTVRRAYGISRNGS